MSDDYKRPVYKTKKEKIEQDNKHGLSIECDEHKYNKCFKKTECCEKIDCNPEKIKFKCSNLTGTTGINVIDINDATLQTPMTIGTISVTDLCCFKRPCVQLNVSAVIVTISFISINTTVIFRVFRRCDNGSETEVQSFNVSLGDIATIPLASTPVSFTICDNIACSSNCCTYRVTVEAIGPFPIAMALTVSQGGISLIARECDNECNNHKHQYFEEVDCKPEKIKFRCNSLIGASSINAPSIFEATIPTPITIGTIRVTELSCFKKSCVQLKISFIITALLTTGISILATLRVFRRCDNGSETEVRAFNLVTILLPGSSFPVDLLVCDFIECCSNCCTYRVTLEAKGDVGASSAFEVGQGGISLIAGECDVDCEPEKNKFRCNSLIGTTGINAIPIDGDLPVIPVPTTIGTISVTDLDCFKKTCVQLEISAIIIASASEIPPGTVITFRVFRRCDNGSETEVQSINLPILSVIAPGSSIPVAFVVCDHIECCSKCCTYRITIEAINPPETETPFFDVVQGGISLIAGECDDEC
ncbi:hypothetical protein CLPU_5c00020 [Gottschalkia purinilytica]|uniref:DUF4489 domain-containing protein n=1 Tax=Gottschalkia purinilytica TaxID=1503 RepID=A0A0L0WBH5_GOTPU|nr:DUF4489 domain-containing protein [Gottschalkia purinilytica]KNF08695.1 hypothetical protein CLPU_5c00020 [Gottschalkia purinilytica]